MTDGGGRFSDRYWSLGKTLYWIVHRKEQPPASPASHVSEEQLKQEAPIYHNYLADLNAAVQAGEITAEGRPSEYPDMPGPYACEPHDDQASRHYEVIPPIKFDTLRKIDIFEKFHIVDNGEPLGEQFWEAVRDPGPFYYHVRFQVSEVKRLWPAIPSAGNQRTKFPGNDQRPKPTRERVVTWLQERVECWPDESPAPSEEVDWNAARSHFGEGLRRDYDFRPIREKATPHEWRKPGPRKPWGQVKKAAENSAKLRSQD